jgi:hypothetical protein
MIIRPGLIGETEEDAALHLVVICEPELETSVRSFFTQPHIADGILRSPNGEKLGSFIISATPRMRSEDLDISVHCHSSVGAHTYPDQPIKLFMQGCENLPDPQFEEVLGFAKAAASERVHGFVPISQRRAWLDDRCDDDGRHYRPYSGYLTAPSLREHLKEKVGPSPRNIITAFGSNI